MSKRNIFISYRRRSSKNIAGRIEGYLSNLIGDSRVFMDVEDIEAGRDFREEIDKRVRDSSVTLALISKDWASSFEEKRTKGQDDLVAYEISQALASGQQVIPILVNGASMPEPEKLPVEIRKITGRHAVRVTHRKFKSDMRELCKEMVIHVPDSPSASRLPVVVTSIALSALGFAGIATYFGMKPGAARAELSDPTNREREIEIFPEMNDQAPFVKLKPPQEVTILDTKPLGDRGTYYKVRLRFPEGWIARDHTDAKENDPNFEFTSIPEHPVKHQYYPAVILYSGKEGLKVRESPSIHSGDKETPIRASLLKDSKVEVEYGPVERDDHIWFRVKIDDGWIFRGQRDTLQLRSGAW